MPEVVRRQLPITASPAEIALELRKQAADHDRAHLSHLLASLGVMCAEAAKFSEQAESIPYGVRNEMRLASQDIARRIDTMTTIMGRAK